eukprot:5310237-Prymnesium_polylepis.1
MGRVPEWDECGFAHTTGRLNASPLAVAAREHRSHAGGRGLDVAYDGVLHALGLGGLGAVEHAVAAVDGEVGVVGADVVGRAERVRVGALDRRVRRATHKERRHAHVANGPRRRLPRARRATEEFSQRRHRDRVGQQRGGAHGWRQRDDA